MGKIYSFRARDWTRVDDKHNAKRIIKHFILKSGKEKNKGWLGCAIRKDDIIILGRVRISFYELNINWLFHGEQKSRFTKQNLQYMKIIHCI